MSGVRYPSEASSVTQLRLIFMKAQLPAILELIITCATSAPAFASDLFSYGRSLRELRASQSR